MRRRAFMTLVGGAVVAAGRSRAQTAARVARIGFFEAGTRANQRFLDAFRQGLREHGYVDGDNAVVLERWGVAGPPERVRALIGELLAARIDVLVAAATTSVQAAMAATATVPIVMVGIGDPVGSGFAATLARPGRNATGLSLVLPEMHAKQAELLKEAVPGIRRLAVMWCPGDPGSAARFGPARDAVTALGLEPVPLPVADAPAIERALAKEAGLAAEAMIALLDPLTVAATTRIGALSAARRLPAVHMLRSFAESGGLLAYGTSKPDQFYRAAGYVAKILAGAKPGDLPIEQPSKFELVVNLRTARALDLAIPPALLGRADEVIE
jgi:putative ABC transport system substrate-binding protein